MSTKERVKLMFTEQQLKMMFLRAVTTVTFYRGKPPVDFLQERVKKILELNPWLTGDLVKLPTGEIVIEFERSNSININWNFSVMTSNTIKSSDSYSTLSSKISKMKHVCVPTGFTCLNRKIPLYYVMLIINPEANEYAFTASLSHVLGDGYTFYALYRMLGINETPSEMIYKRDLEFEAQRAAVVGHTHAFWESPEIAAGYILSVIRTVFVWIILHLILRQPSYRISSIDEEWVQHQKKLYNKEKSYISSNDAITSWFFKLVDCDIGVMAMNLRTRVVNIGKKHAGNYDEVILYQRPDFETPQLIRQSLTGQKFKRVVTGEMSRWNVFKFNVGLVTNWASFYQDVDFESSTQIYHVPVIPDVAMELAYCVVFCPKKGSLAVITSNSSIFNPHSGNPLIPFTYQGMMEEV
ncbi:hypothetical protein BC833DRAFT_582067 [Globomyces pollinis-pini]|nr:hypothetical protein BC833DRAFT_582067 [Globomyces pollinis-pini]KAJ3001021.1 hypothetical protein HDV02_000090 [Globomyces sp. JEL0801]